jgi:RHS repeat-associated protein
MRGYVYRGGSLLAVQQGGVYWNHEDPVTKSRRVTNVYGNVVSSIELDPWGSDTTRSSAAAFQPKKFTSYERDSNGSDEAMFRRYNRKDSRFVQPDPYDGSCSLSDPQSFNRYSYVQNDPVNFTDPTGTMCQIIWEGSISYLQLCTPDGDTWRGYTGGGGKGTGIGDPNPSDPPQNPGPDVNDLRNRIANFLKKPGCADFITSLLSGSATSTNPAVGTDALKLFNEIASSSQKGIVYGDSIYRAYRRTGATIHGSIDTHTAQIELPIPSPFPVGLSRRGAEEYRNAQARINATDALHETMHLGGKYGFDDYTLANTVARMRGVQPGKFAGVFEASDYWDKALAAACF